VRYTDIGVALLEHDANGRVVATGLRLPLSGSPDVEQIADWIESVARTHDVRCLCIDGPSGWQGPDTPTRLQSKHCRLSEKRVRAPGKTGLPPDGVKPSPYLPFTRFSIALFEVLTERGWTLPDGTHGSAHDATAPARLVTETFPTAAWRALGLPVLPGKARSLKDAGVVPSALESLRSTFLLEVRNIHTHDELQAVVGGLAGVWWEAGQPDRVQLAGAPPFRLDGTWREGYIMVPAPFPHTHDAHIAFTDNV